MSERYSRLYELPQNLYAVGSPVVIAAGTLLKDNQTGNVVAQLKFHSISDKIVKVVKVKLDLFDTAGSPIAESVVFDYLDLSASRDAEFGQKTPVPVPDNKVRSYNAAVTEVVFGDKSVWTATGEVWEQLSNPVPLAFGDPELLKQYQLRFGSNSKYTPKEEKGLWHCTCGALNHTGENCHLCRHSLFELQTVDMGELEAEKVARLEKEARWAAEQKAADDIQKQKNKKTLRIVIAAACAIVAVVVLLVSVVKEKAEQKRLETEYADAIALMESGEYEAAVAALEALGDYENSKELLVRATQADKYNDALSALSLGQDEIAYQLFQEAGNYADAALYQPVFLHVKTTIPFPDGSCAEYEYEYNNERQLIRLISNGTETEYFYDSNGKLVSSYTEYTTYTYTKYTKQPIRHVSVEEYNEHGDTIKFIGTEEKNGRVETIRTRTYTYVYNNDGTMASYETDFVIEELQADGSYKVVSTDFDESKFEYEYGQDGRVILRKTYSNGKCYTTSFSYDEYGNLISEKGDSMEYTHEYIMKLVKQE